MTCIPAMCGRIKLVCCVIILLMRKNLLIFFLAVLSVFSLLGNLKLYEKLADNNKVVEVVDGDTFQLKSGKRVRLMGVDAPEYNRCGGTEAKKKLTELILKKTVVLEEEVDEAYGRSLALVFVDNKFINKIMLESGWGRTDYRANSKRDELTAAFHQAQGKKLGIFSSLCREEETKTENGCLIKGNIDKATYKKFYHLPNCKQYNQIIIEKDIGEGYFCTETEAQKAGFQKAAGCP